MASSPAASTTSQDDAPKSKKLEQITFRFCSECSNMLYPKEDEENHKLQFVCRTCQYTEEATSTCVFRNELNGDAGETAGVTQDVGSDPTVGNPSLKPCCLSKVPRGWAIAHDFPDIEDVISCLHCHRRLVKIPITHYLQEGEIDQSTEEALIKTLMNGGFLLPMDELLEYAGEQTADKKWPQELPRSNTTCPECKHTEAVFFQSQQRSSETGMALFYVCCDCGHIFQTIQK